MAGIQMDIQKELIQEELDQILVAFQESIKGNIDLDLLLKTLKIFVKEITPAKEIHLLILSNENSFEISDIENGIPIDLSSSQGMISRCLNRKEPQFTNDVNRYKEYDKKIDNIFDYNLKNLLIMPVQDINNELFAILWAGIPKGDLNQYISADIEHLVQLLDHIEYTMPREKREEEIKHSEEFNSYKEEKLDSPDTLKEYKVESPILVKKIQSWLTGFKKNKK